MKVAIIPARGGSKRIPRKNIRSFCGKPIIAYSIAAARQSGVFDRIIVTTDDEEIAETARVFGAETPFLRPKTLADDYTGTTPVVGHAIRWLNRHQDQPVTFACCIYATAPFVQPTTLREAFQRLSSAPHKRFAFSVTSFPFPIQRAVFLSDDKTGMEPAFPQYLFSARPQDLQPAYHDAGQFYWGRADAFVNDEVVYSPLSIPIVLPRHWVQDIDTPEDWVCAERLYQAMLASGECGSCV